MKFLETLSKQESPLSLNTVVLILAYNEGQRIGRVIEGIKRILPNIDVVVVDDGSKDDCRQRAMEAGAKVISHPFNLGYGSALQTGYKYALAMGYEASVQMDGDGQHDTSFISDLLAILQQDEADIVIGSRFLKRKDGESDPFLYRAPFTRKVGMGLFRTITFPDSPEGHGFDLGLSGHEPQGTGMGFGGTIPCGLPGCRCDHHAPPCGIPNQGGTGSDV